jgi:hypothetical protein
LIDCSCSCVSGYEVDIFSITLLYFLTIMGISYFLFLLWSRERGDRVPRLLWGVWAFRYACFVGMSSYCYWFDCFVGYFFYSICLLGRLLFCGRFSCFDSSAEKRLMSLRRPFRVPIWYLRIKSDRFSNNSDFIL